MESLIVVLSAKGVQAESTAVTAQVLVENGFLILDQKQLLLQNEEVGVLETEEPQDFVSGPVVAFYVQHEQAFATMAAIADELDDIYYSATPYCALRDKELLFRETRHLERLLVIIKPAADEKARIKVRESLEKNSFVILDALTTKLERDVVSQIFYDAQDDISHVSSGESLCLIIEKIGAIVEWQLVMGPLLLDEARKHAPNSLRAQLGSGPNNISLVYGSHSVGQAAIDIPLVFPSPLPLQRTVALVKPDAVANGSAELIKQAFVARGFSILSAETLYISRNRAEIFYASLKGTPDFEEQSSFLSSGPSVAFLLSKPAAVETLIKLCGPEDPLSARIDAPGTLRALFGTDPLKNALHCSSSIAVAEDEIRFFFPQIGADRVPSMHDVQNILQRTQDPGIGGGAQKKSLQAVLVEGLTQLCREKPVGLEAVSWLGRWLLRNNPNKPVVQAVVELPPDEPEDAQPAKNRFDQLVLCVGGPAGPKDQVLRRVADTLKWNLISSADVLRLARENGSDHGQLVHECITEGKVIPAHITVHIIKEYLDRAAAGSKNKRFIINDFPYSIDHALEFERHVAPVSSVLHFDASDQTLTERIQASASTDPASIKRIVQQYREDVAPILSHYSVHNKLSTLDCNPMPGGDNVLTLALVDQTIAILSPPKPAPVIPKPKVVKKKAPPKPVEN